MRAWTQYWLTAVSSAVRTSLSSAMTCGSPFMVPPPKDGGVQAPEDQWEAEGSAVAADRQSGPPRRGHAAQESSMRASIASRQAPQSVPAPQQAATASTLRAPAWTAASISRSVTARQMQRPIGPRQLLLRLILNIKNRIPPGSPQCQVGGYPPAP